MQSYLGCQFFSLKLRISELGFRELVTLAFQYAVDDLRDRGIVLASMGSFLNVLLGSVESLPGQSSSSSGNISETPPKIVHLKVVVNFLSFILICLGSLITKDSTGYLRELKILSIQ